MANWPSELKKIAKISVWVVTEPTPPFRNVEFEWDRSTQGSGVRTRSSLQLGVKKNELGG